MYSVVGDARREPTGEVLRLPMREGRQHPPDALGRMDRTTAAQPAVRAPALAMVEVS